MLYLEQFIHSILETEFRKTARSQLINIKLYSLVETQIKGSSNNWMQASAKTVGGIEIKVNLVFFLFSKSLKFPLGLARLALCQTSPCLPIFEKSEDSTPPPWLPNSGIRMGVRLTGLPAALPSAPFS